MGVIDAPQWLLPAYIRSMKAVGATAPLEQLQAASERLIAMWRSPDRCFHNLKHAIDMLARVDELADESHNPDIMRLAVWYHGCVFSSATEQTYKRNGGEDEVASAAYAAQDLSGLGVPDKVTDRVCALILNLKRHNLTGEDIDASALNDADLGTLAVEPQLYKRYRELVRQEYAHIPDSVYLQARLAIVTRLLSRDQLFSSPLGQRWELPARQNLEAERRRLTDQLAALQSQDPAGSPAPDAAAPDRTEGAGAPSPQAGPQAAAQSVPASPQASPAAPAAPSVPTAPAAPAQAAPTAQAAAAQVQAPQPAAPPVPARGAGEQAAPPAATTAPSAQTPVPPAAAGSSAPATAQTPSSGVRRISILSRSSDVPASSREEVTPVRQATSRHEAGPGRQASPTEREDLLEHTTTMEACIADIDRLMTTPRQTAAAPVPRRQAQAPGAVPDRRSIVEAAQASLADRLEAKARQARAAREARTGELAAMTGEVPLQAPAEDD